MEKLNLKAVVFCLLSGFLGIVIGVACAEKPQIMSDNVQLILGTYQDYVETNNQLLAQIEEIESTNEGNFLNIKEESDIYQELLWLNDIIVKNNYSKLETDNEILEDYHNYYQSTEILLDSLYEWQENYWLDVVFETDAYYYYTKYREEIENEY